MSVSVRLCVPERFHYAQAINQVPFISGIRIKNTGKEPVGKSRLEFSSEPEFFRPKSVEVPPLAPGESVSLDNICLDYEAGRLANYTEAVFATVKARLVSGRETLREHDHTVELRPFDEISHQSRDRVISAAYVQPNHPLIVRLLSRIGELRGKRYGNYDIDGYLGTKEGRMEMAACMFQAVKEQEIRYVTGKPSSLAGHQRIRLVDEILREKQGNCMDMTLLFASLLEGMGLRPLIIILKDHALAGFFNEEKSFAQPVFTDIGELHKRMAKGIGQIVVFECTLARKGLDATFEDAVASAGKRLARLDKLEPSLDVYRARQGGVAPLPSRLMTTRIDVVPDKETGKVEKVHLDGGQEDDGPAKAYETPDRLKRWQNRLLDMTARSPLLNIPVSSQGRGAMLLLTVDPGDLYRRLCRGESFAVEACPQDFDETKRSRPLFEKACGVYACQNIVMENMRQGILHTTYTDATLKKALSALRSRDRQWREDKGAGILYITFGTLRWKDEKSGKRYEAPLLMLPARFCKDGRRYKVEHSGGSIFFNAAVLELLRQRFDKRPDGIMPEPLGRDGYPDLEAVLKNLRIALEGEPDLDVHEPVCLGLFPFSQYLMWQELVEWGKTFLEHPLVGSVKEGVLRKEVNDQKSEVVEALFPAAADETQQKAVRAFLQGLSMVLYGPPGTGKSQTITNMLANGIGQGRTVLFAAQKAAALHVVYDRMEKLGLSDFCLYLPEELGRQSETEAILTLFDRVLRMEGPEENGYEEEAKREAIVREILENDSGLFTKNSVGGKTLGEWIDLYIRLDDGAGHFRTFPEERQEEARVLDEKLLEGGMDGLVSLLDELAEAGKAAGRAKDHPLRGLCLADDGFDTRGQLRAALERFIAAMEELGRTAPETREETPAKCLRDIQRKRVFLQIPKSLRYEKDLEKKLEIWAEWLSYTAARRKLLGAAGDGLMALPVTELHKEWQEIRWRTSPLKRFRKNAIRRQVSDAAGRSLASDKEVTELLKTASRLAGDRSKTRPDFTLPLDLEGTARMREILKKYFPKGLENESYVNLVESDGGELERKAAIIGSALRAEQGLTCLLSDASGICMREKTPEEARQVAGRWLDGLYRLPEWSRYQKIRKACLEAGLGPWVDMWEEGASKEWLNRDFAGYASGRMIRNLYESHGDLKRFSGGHFGYVVEKYKEMRERMEKMAAGHIRAAHISRIRKLLKDPDMQKQKTDLKKIIESGGKGTSLRQIFDLCGPLILALTPCVMVSPLTAPLYLDPEKIAFEHLILDEASQIPTSKAIGLLARCRHAVIAGDPYQMPPTAFFESERSDERVPVLDEDQESVLKEFIALGLPEYELEWHYRSRHESLIAFSNQRYYGGRMITFPSADDRESRVKAVRVPGVYDRGKSMTNRIEAQALVDFLEGRFREGDERSYGVITFNQRQQELIRGMVEKRAREDAAFAKALDCMEEKGAPLFIRNLETVQGDERDVIMFSVGYGPDPNGKIAMTFGPLGRIGGWRRLNVAITRAKDEMILFASLDPGQLTTDRKTPRGVADLKAFLAYAFGEPLASDAAGAACVSGLQEKIQEALEGKGYKTVCNVGRSELKVDVAVLDPDGSGRYILGIMTEGTGKRPDMSVYDREVGRQKMLEERGWNGMRIWSGDWLADPEREIGRIQHRLNALREESHVGGMTDEK